MTSQQAGIDRHRLFRIECIRQGKTAAAIGRALGVHRSAVAQVVRGEARSHRIESAITRLFPELIHLYPFPPSNRILTGTLHVDYCPCVQPTDDQPERPDPVLDPRVRAAAELTLRQRELLAAVRDAGGRVRLGDLQGFSAQALPRLATALRDRGYLRAPGLVVLDSEVELVEVA